MRYVSRTSPYRHQECALAKMIAKKGGALLMEPGTGKTKVAVDFCGRVYMERGLERVLVIAPLSALGIWEREVEKHLGEGVPRRVIKLRRGIKNKVKQIEEMEQVPITITARTEGTPGTVPISERSCLTFVIVNYESVWHPEMFICLQDFEPQCVIVDESHKIKNPTAAQSKAVCKFSRVAYRLILTGTPITKSPLDIFGQWKFLQPDVFGESWWRFKLRYAVFGGYKNYEIVKFKNLEDLRHKVRHNAYIASKEECLDLPETVYQNIEVELTETTREMYDRMEKDFLLLFGEGQSATAPIILTKMLRLSQITGGFVTNDQHVDHQIGSEKLQHIKDLLSVYTYPSRKIVVFARFLWEIKQIATMAKQVMLDPIVFTGETPVGQRDAVIQTFQTDPAHKLFIAQIATGGLSIDLTAAETVIFYSLDYDLGHYIQASDRVHRMGQLKKVLYLHLIAKDTIDEVVCEALQTKGDLADIVVEYVRRKAR